MVAAVVRHGRWAGPLCALLGVAWILLFPVLTVTTGRVWVCCLVGRSVRPSVFFSLPSPPPVYRYIYIHTYVHIHTNNEWTGELKTRGTYLEENALMPSLSSPTLDAGVVRLLLYFILCIYLWGAKGSSIYSPTEAHTHVSIHIYTLQK